MKKLFASILLALLLPMLSTAAPSVPAELVGHYYLSGMTEAGSEMRLKADGSFEWMLAYGSADLYATGTWELNDGKVTLTSAAQEKPEFRLFAEDEYRNTRSAKPGIWVAVVGFPGRGPLPGVEVRFESSDGQTVSAVSQPNGDAIVNMPDTVNWVRAGLKMKETDAPYQWLVLPADRSKARLAGFTATNPLSVLPRSFQTMVLVREGSKLRPDEDAVVRGVYTKGE